VKKCIWGWRDGSGVKSTDCSSEGPEFKSQQPHGGSQPSIMRSDALFWVSEDSYNVLRYNNKEILKKKKRKKERKEKEKVHLTESRTDGNGAVN
jgi:hypothetical protein